jgi:serine/threonine protein kinase
MPVDPKEHPCVAIKELKSTSLDEKEFKTVLESEVNFLEILRGLDHPHLIKAIAYYEKEDKHFLMFPWARGGNLRDFWKKEPPTLDQPYMEWVFDQLTGLAGAIMKLHNFSKDKHWRHGDLKPENILCFHDGISYTLVIADVGLSKEHDKVTELRAGPTTTKSGTIMYEPPESEILAQAPRSRRYDIWSIGCIYLEFVVWLLYGTQGLRQVREELNSTARDGNVRFYVIDPNESCGFRLNDVVQKWIEHAQKDHRCTPETALGRFINLIVTQLLVAEDEMDEMGMRRVNRADSFISRTDSDPTEPPTPSIVVRAATFRPDDDPFPRRASAERLYRGLKSIYDDAVSEPEKWLQWGAPVQEAPEPYVKKNLTPTDALSAHGRNINQPEVRLR